MPNVKRLSAIGLLVVLSSLFLFHTLTSSAIAIGTVRMTDATGKPLQSLFEGLPTGSYMAKLVRNFGASHPKCSLRVDGNGKLVPGKLMDASCGGGGNACIGHYTEISSSGGCQDENGKECTVYNFHYSPIANYCDGQNYENLQCGINCCTNNFVCYQSDPPYCF